MKEKDHIREELEGLSPFLARIKEKGLQPPRAPEAYFQSLPDDVLRRIRAEEGLVREEAPIARAGRRKGLWRPVEFLMQHRYAAGLAGAAALVAVGLYLFWPDNPEAIPQPAAMASLSREEIAEYITTNIELFDISLLVEASGPGVDEAPNPDLFQGVGDEELNRYLEQYLEETSLDELEDLL